MSKRYESFDCVFFYWTHEIGVRRGNEIILFRMNRWDLFDVCSWPVFSLHVFFG